MEFDDLDDLYRDTILDHRRNPRHSDVLENPNTTAKAINPFCGDEIYLQLRFDENGRVSDVGLQGEGCSINQAAGSMLTEALKGKSLDEIEKIDRLYRSMMQGDMLSEDEIEFIGDLGNLVGVRQFPVRIKCAMLTWSALEDAIDDYKKSLSR